MSFFDAVLEATGVAEAGDPIDLDRVVPALRERYGLQGRLDRIPTEKDDTFRLRAADGRDYLVKCSPGSEDPEVVALQTAAMVHLEEQSPELPVQRVIPTLDGERAVPLPVGGRYPRMLRVLSFLSGTLLRDSAPTMTQWMLAGRMLGRVTRAMEGFVHPRDERRLLWDMAGFHRLPELLTYVTDAGHRARAEQVYASYLDVVVPRLPELERQVIHGDFSPYNAVVDPAAPDFVTGIIDFGDVVRTCVVFDVAVGMANLIGADADDPWGRAVSFLGGYQQTRPLSADDAALLREIALGRLLLRALVTDWRAGVDPDRHAYLFSHAARDWSCLESAWSADAADVRAALRRTATPGRPARPTTRVPEGLERQR